LAALVDGSWQRFISEFTCSRGGGIWQTGKF
jgi:hypothetical protein